VTTTFRALGDATRLAIVTRLVPGPATVSDLAAEHGMSLPGMLKHLAVLDEAGLVRRHKTGRVVTCRLAPEGLLEAQHWLRDRTAHWSAALDRLDTLLDQTLPDETGPDPIPPPASRREADR